MTNTNNKNNPIDDLINDFQLFDGWEERYSYLIELGNRLPPFDPLHMNDAYFVPGCISKVWMVPSFSDDNVLTFTATSNGDITKGMIYILYLAYNGLRKDAIQDVDISGIFEALGLQQHITAQRRNGFYAMVERIKSYGEAGD
ncbi:MAG: hypothetical protein CMH30_07460 [Micavibrio sp.]|nr:hypothetical protein [Micavibrio sp.]|tara:strand:+ start:4051 stop:4479 length:429 start_codon:yes stop_codon:yes gene_type:complete